MTLKNEVLEAYDLEPQHVEVKPIHNGLINSTWQIKNSHHSYILQKINHQVFKDPAAIAFNVRMIADYLLKKKPDYLFVCQIKTNTDQEIMHLKGNGYFRLTNFIKNSHTITIVEKPRQAFEAARKFGEFTHLLSEFPVHLLKVTIPDFHNLSLRYQQFQKALKEGNKVRLRQSKELIRFIKDNKDIVDTYEAILQNPSFKLRVTHHDTKISNVLFDKADEGICIIDLDTLMPGYFISDVGDMMRTYLSPANEEEKDFSNIEIREEYFKAIWNGYMTDMKLTLTAEEKSHFIYAGKFMIYMQAIRFLTDHLNDDTYYGAKYEGNNFIRAGNQVVLLQKLLEKEDALKKIMN